MCRPLGKQSRGLLWGLCLDECVGAWLMQAALCGGPRGRKAWACMCDCENMCVYMRVHCDSACVLKYVHVCVHICV